MLGHTVGAVFENCIFTFPLCMSFTQPGQSPTRKNSGMMSGGPGAYYRFARIRKGWPDDARGLQPAICPARIFDLSRGRLFVTRRLAIRQALLAQSQPVKGPKGAIWLTVPVRHRGGARTIDSSRDRRPAGLARKHLSP